MGDWTSRQICLRMGRNQTILKMTESSQGSRTPPSQEELITQIREGRWQEQAEALSIIKNGVLWAQWNGPRGEPYISFPAFCIDMGLSGPTCYERAKLADDPRFDILRSINISISLVKRLYKLPPEDPLFKILALLIQLGLPEDEALELLSAEAPISKVRKIASARISQQQSAIRELKRQLQK